MRRRPTAHNEYPPPDYGPDANKLCTLCLHYGGKFTSDFREWVGGGVTKFDFVEKSKIDILWLIGFANLSIGCTTYILPYSRHKNGYRFFLIRRLSQLLKIVDEHIELAGEIDIYIIEGEGVEVSEEGHSLSSEGVGEEEDYRADAESGALVGETGKNIESAAVVDSDAERRRKGKTPVVDSDVSDEFSSDSDYSFNSDCSVSDDKLFDVNIDNDEEWIDETQSLGGVNEDSELSEGNEDGRNELGEDNLLESEDDFRSLGDDDEIGDKVPVYSEKQKYSPVFVLGMIFNTKKEFKELVDSHAIMENRSIAFTRSDKDRVYAKCCAPDCPFKIHLRKRKNDSTFEITVLYGDHNCVPTVAVRNMNSKWLSGRYGYEFKGDKKRNVDGFRESIGEKLRCEITWWQAYKCKQLTLHKEHGNAEEQYALLWSYANELRRTNPGSTVKLGVEPFGEENKFSKFYVCLEPLKRGFLSACRPLFGIDGTFLKGPFGGILLCAVGIDPNNNLFPIAWAVVSKEDGENWEWFLKLLKADLEIVNDHEWTIVSDKQKGLIKAVGDVFPNVGHRFCVTHMHSNFLVAGYRGQILKTALWRAAKASTVADFRRRMEDIKKMNTGAFDWLKEKHPSQWSRSHFSTQPKCDVLVNNICESFNSKILKARELPILSMLEKIFSEMMKRMRENRELGDRWKGPYCPRIQETIDFNNSKVPDCKPFKSSDVHYQIHCFDGSQYAVDLSNKTCGCRKWDLTGIPCKHALCAISSQKLSLDGFVDPYYKVETYRKAYSPCIMPINGRSEWEPSDCIPPLPPQIVRQAGRPPRARRRGADEPAPKRRRRKRGRPAGPRDAHHKKRNQETIRCSSCGIQGHNKRGCEGKSAEEQALQQREEELSGEHVEEDVLRAMEEELERAMEEDEPQMNNTQVDENVPTQSQLTQATEFQDDILIDDEYMREIEEILAQNDQHDSQQRGRPVVVTKKKGNGKIGSSVTMNKKKVMLRKPPPFVGVQEEARPFEPPKKKIGPIVKIRGTKFLVLSKCRN